MLIKKISNKLEKINTKPIGTRCSSAVLIPLIKIDGQFELIYQLRSNNLNTQPGEISFPGGGVEHYDKSYEETAIRETMEELNINRGNINILGEINYLVSKNDTLIKCFVGEILHVEFEDINPCKDEVDHLFTVPLDFLLKHEPEKHEIILERNFPDDFPFNLLQNGNRYKWRTYKDVLYFYNYDSYTIWGWTARITKEFIENIIE